MKNLVIDPGHGGSDNGATAYNGTYEKRYALEISLKIYDILKQYIPVTLTRSTDKTLSLKDRANIAKAKGPCYLMSMHFNAYNKSTSGIEIFKSLWNSSNWAAGVCSAAAKEFGLVNRGQKTRKLSGKNADYYYLHRETGSNVTCYIIETCFLDNKNDFNWLINNGIMGQLAVFYCDQILKGLYNIDMNANPYTDTYLKWMYDNGLIKDKDHKPGDHFTKRTIGMLLKRFHDKKL